MATATANAFQGAWWEPGPFACCHRQCLASRKGSVMQGTPHPVKHHWSTALRVRCANRLARCCFFLCTNGSDVCKNNHDVSIHQHGSVADLLALAVRVLIESQTCLSISNIHSCTITGSPPLRTCACFRRMHRFYVISLLVSTIRSSNIVQ